MTPRRALVLEQLGHRILPSAAPPLPHPATPTGAVVASQPHDFAGQGGGRYVAASLVADAGVGYSLKGEATLARLGHVEVTGSVHGLGLVASGHAAGTLTLANGHGSVRVELKGPGQKGLSPLPMNWGYTVVAATGGYRSLKGERGSLRLTFQADLAPAPALGRRPVGVPSPYPHPQGTFHLSMGGGASPAVTASGIDGLALVGPTSPVLRPGGVYTRPLPGAVVLVEGADGRVVTQAVADQDGRFHVDVAPGTYLLVPLPPVPGATLPRGTPQTVVVTAGGDANVTLRYDSGIL